MKHRLSPTLLPFALLLLSGLSVGAVAAEAETSPAPQETAEAGESGESESTADRPDQPAKVLTGAEQRRANDKGGVFRPSENISEDLPLAFPVDI